jgi:hypothetical protein
MPVSPPLALVEPPQQLWRVECDDSQTDEHGHPLFSGIRYESRLGPHECWAIFDGTAVGLVEEVTVEVDSPALLAKSPVESGRPERRFALARCQGPAHETE